MTKGGPGHWASEYAVGRGLREGVYPRQEPRAPSTARVRRAKEQVGKDPRQGHNEECACFDCLRDKVLVHMPIGTTMNRRAQRKYYRKMRRDGVPRPEAMARLMIEARLHHLDLMRRG